MIWYRIVRYLKFSATIEQTDDLFKYIDNWIAKTYPEKLKKVEIQTNEGLKGSHENDYIYIWKYFRYIRISKTKSEIDAPGERFDLFRRTYTISGLFAKKAIFRLLNDVYETEKKLVEQAKERKKEIRVFIYNSDSYETWKYTRGKLTGKDLDNVYLSNKALIEADVNNFINSKELFERFKMPAKRGYLFYGPPGTGKSTLAWAIANKLKYDIYIVDLAAFKSAGDFKAAMSRIPEKSVIVFEDIDSFYDQRELAGSNKIPFSTFINSLSGINQVDEVVTIITTNHLEKLDSAILRSGRCDAKFEINAITINEAQQFLRDKVDSNITLTSFKDMPFVELQELAFKYKDNTDELIKIIQ